jgi:hypothetical protein
MGGYVWKLHYRHVMQGFTMPYSDRASKSKLFSVKAKQGCTKFPNKSYLKILGAGRMIRNKFLTEDPQIQSATAT